MSNESEEKNRIVNTQQSPGAVTDPSSEDEPTVAGSKSSTVTLGGLHQGEEDLEQEDFSQDDLVIEDEDYRANINRCFVDFSNKMKNYESNGGLDKQQAPAFRRAWELAGTLQQRLTDNQLSLEQKLTYIAAFEEQTRSIHKIWRFLGQALGGLIGGCLGAVIGGITGTVIGLAVGGILGTITGPGAFFTAVFGGVTGGHIGTITGACAGASIGIVTGFSAARALTEYGLHRNSMPVDKFLKELISDCRTVIKYERPETAIEKLTNRFVEYYNNLADRCGFKQPSQALN